MKKILLSLSFALAAVSLSYAQLEIIKPGDNNILNDSTTVIYGSPTAQMTSTFWVINSGDSSMTVWARRDYISVLGDTKNEICWAGFCYDSTHGVSDYSEVIGKGDTAKFGNTFNGDYFPSGQVGTSTIRYTFYDSKDHADSSWVIVEYISQLDFGIQNISDRTIGFSSPYPNPANTSVNFNYSLAKSVQSASLKIFNLLGECIQTLPLNPAKNKTILNVQSMPSGIYICEIEASGCQPAYQKLIVTH